MSKRVRGTWLLGALFGLAAVSGCQGRGGTAEPVPPTVPAQRAAQSFVHCVEIDGGGCVTNHPEFAAWDAFSLLGWLASGSPTSILEALPRELNHHASQRSIQQRFVRQVDDQSMVLRGAECSPENAAAFGELLPKLREAVQQRMTAMGIWGPDLEVVVDGLVEEARRGLADGYLIGMRCQSDPWRVYMATSKGESRFIVVGMLMELPEFLGGDSPARDASSGRLRSIHIGRDSQTMSAAVENAIHPWVQIPVQEF